MAHHDGNTRKGKRSRPRFATKAQRFNHERKYRYLAMNKVFGYTQRARMRRIPAA